MKEGQQKIYYVVADSFNAAKHSPHLEIFRKKGIEVLLLSDRIDEWLMSHLTEFDGKSFADVAKGELDLGDVEDEAEKKSRKKPPRPRSHWSSGSRKRWAKACRTSRSPIVSPTRRPA